MKLFVKKESVNEGKKLLRFMSLIFLNDSLLEIALKNYLKFDQVFIEAI